MTAQSISERLDAAMAVLKAHDAVHLAAGLDDLSESDLDAFIQQVDSIDFEEFDRLRNPSPAAERPDPTIEPATVVPRHPEGEAAFRKAGVDAIARGEVAAFTVATGRLEAPRGSPVELGAAHGPNTAPGSARGRGGGGLRRRRGRHRPHSCDGRGRRGGRRRGGLS